MHIPEDCFFLWQKLHSLSALLEASQLGLLCLSSLFIYPLQLRQFLRGLLSEPSATVTNTTGTPDIETEKQ